MDVKVMKERKNGIKTFQSTYIEIQHTAPCSYDDRDNYLFLVTTLFSLISRLEAGRNGGDFFLVNRHIKIDQFDSLAIKVYMRIVVFGNNCYQEASKWLCIIY